MNIRLKIKKARTDVLMKMAKAVGLKISITLDKRRGRLFETIATRRNKLSASPRWLVQYQLSGQWITCATRKRFDAACAKARSEAREMKHAHSTSVIQDGDPETLRRHAESNFQL